MKNKQLNRDELETLNGVEVIDTVTIGGIEFTQLTFDDAEEGTAYYTQSTNLENEELNDFFADPVELPATVEVLLQTISHTIEEEAKTINAQQFDLYKTNGVLSNPNTGLEFPTYASLTRYVEETEGVALVLYIGDKTGN